MNARPNFAANGAGRDIGSSQSKPLEAMLADGSTNPREVSEAVHALGDADLMTFGLRAYHLNLLSLFGETWSREKIARTARAAAISKILGGWDYHHCYLPSLTAAADEPQLEGIPLELVRDVLARGRGLAIATFHLGPMRYVPSDLAHAGIASCVPLARDSFNDYRTARVANYGAALWKCKRPVNVEDSSGALTLARTLAEGGCVISALDGNTGLDGPRGDQRRTIVEILDSKARVKTGLIGMAARFGSPVLVMVTYTSAGKRHCRAAPMIDPGRALRGEEAERFVEAGAQSAYSFFGAALQEHAGEWCGGDLFHQWRVPGESRQQDLQEVERLLELELGAGGRLTINHRRIVPLSGDGNMIWSDAVSGRCYKLPAEMAALAGQLIAHGGGVGFDWLGRHSDAERARMWAFLCQLASRDAIKTIERSDHDERAKSDSEIVRPSVQGASDTSEKMHRTVERI